MADTGNHAIRRINISTGVVTTLAGNIRYGLVDGFNATLLRRPNAVAAHLTSQYLLVADTENNVIRALLLNSTIWTFAGDGHFGYRDGAVATARFAHPMGILIDSVANKVYVSDSRNHVIRLIYQGIFYLNVMISLTVTHNSFCLHLRFGLDSHWLWPCGSC